MKPTINIIQLPVGRTTGEPAMRSLFTRLSVAIALLCICQPLSLQAQELKYSVSNGEVTITGYTGTATELIIPVEIEGLPVTTIANSALAYCGDLTYVTLPDTLTNLESLAFKGCTNLIEVTIPASVKAIGIAPFLECTSLTQILVQEGNTAFRSVDGVLYDFSMEILIQVPPTKSGEYIIPNTVTNIRSCAFQYCSEITDVALPDSITAIKDGTFAYCSKLTEMKIPDSVKWIGEGAFNECSNLFNVTFPASLDSIHDGAFANCISLASVSIPDSLTVLGAGAFRNCVKLTSVTIPDGVTSINHGAFRDCTNLLTVTIPNSVRTIQDLAFLACTSLTSVTIPASVTDIQGTPFAGCTSLMEILVSEDNLNYTSVGGVLFGKSMQTLLKYPPSRGGDYIIPDSVTYIRYDAFVGCTSLTSITIPDSVTSLGGFVGCTSLMQILVSEDNLEYTSEGGVLFDKSMEILMQYPPGRGGDYIIPDSVTYIDYSAFAGCTILTSVTIPASVTDIEDSAFEGCTSLTSVTIPNSVSYIGYGAFWGCSGLTSVTIDSTPDMEIFGEPFENCPSLTSIYCLGEPPASYVCGNYGCFLHPFNWAIGPFTVYYIPGTPGWNNTPEGVTVAPLDPDKIWGRYLLVEATSGTYVDTGAWLGWLEVSYSPWVWHYATGNWMYIREPVAEANCGWVYMLDVSTDAPELELVMIPDCCYGYSCRLKRWLYVAPEVSANHAGWVYML